MIKVDKHISELLYEHDCVIIPEFGGFVANYTSAKIHPVQHIFIPPSKNIIFNKNLKNNDGLLASHIASAEKTSYPEALKYLHLFTSRTNSQLKQGGKVEIEEVGTLYLDIERNLQFEQGNTNFLLDAFGLSEFQSRTIKQDNIGKRIEKEFKDRGAIPFEKKKINGKRIALIAVALPLIVAMIWIPLKTDLLKNIIYSNLNPFALKEAAKNIVSENVKSNPSITKAIESAPLAKVNDTVKYTGFKITPTISQEVAADKVDNKIAGVVKIDTTRVELNNANNIPDLKFHLITGCFQIQDNANKFVTDLQNQNITASIIGKRNGLYIVSAGDYATRKEAFMQLKQLKKSQPEAWLLKKL